MALLSSFQELELCQDKNEEPAISAISGDALKLLVASSLNVIHLYSRFSVTDHFTKESKPFSDHGHLQRITALAIQDSGAHAVSGDKSGAIHIWRTDDTSIKARYKFQNGNVTALSISTKFILACFFDESSKNGKMLLIRKGLNLKENLIIEKEYDGDYKLCSISEYGKPTNPYLMYFHNENLIFEGPIQENAEVRKKVLPQPVRPWCLRRNKGANLFVISSASCRDLLLWAPMHDQGHENPIIFRLNSEENLPLNHTLEMSSVIASKMFLASIYGKKIHVMGISRQKLPKSGCCGDSVLPKSNISTSNRCPETHDVEENGSTEEHSQREENKKNSVLMRIAEYVKDPGNGNTLLSSQLQQRDSLKVEQKEVLGADDNERRDLHCSSKSNHSEELANCEPYSPDEDRETMTNQNMSENDTVAKNSAKWLDKSYTEASYDSDISTEDRDIVGNTAKKIIRHYENSQNHNTIGRKVESGQENSDPGNQTIDDQYNNNSEMIEFVSDGFWDLFAQ